MSLQRHGLSIGMERVGNNFYLIMKAVGKLTHEDYSTFIPMLENALAGISDPHINAFFDATEFEGWELRAAWDDFKIGLKHGGAFDKLAIVGENKWKEKMATIASWFMSGEVEYFEDADAAIAWLEE